MVEASDVGFGTVPSGTIINLGATPKVPMVTSFPTDLVIAAGVTEATASYVDVTYKQNGALSPTATVALLSGSEVRVTVTGGMASGDKITVTYHNVRAHIVTDMMENIVHVSISDTDGPYDNNSLNDIKVIPPNNSLVQMKPPRVDVGTKRSTVSMIYTARDRIPNNIVTVNLPAFVAAMPETELWKPVYANGGGAGDVGFGTGVPNGTNNKSGCNSQGADGNFLSSGSGSSCRCNRSNRIVCNGEVRNASALIKYCYRGNNKQRQSSRTV